MRYFQYFGVVILTMLAGCNNYDSFVVTEKPYVNQKSVQLYFGEHAGDRSTIQLVSSPVGKNYTWTSQDPTVATVDQNGLVKAVGEGITSIVVSSKDDQTIIDVNVKKYIPLVGFTLSTHSVIGFWQNTTQIFVSYIPDNATEVDLAWISSNDKVAKVYNNGLIKTLEEGRAIITAKFGNLEQTVNVWVPAPPVKMNKTGWRIPGYNPNSNEGTIGYSSQQRSDGGGVPSIIDDNLATYWHASYSNPKSKYPHWIIIDLGEEVTIAQVGMARRMGDGRGQKGYQVFTCKATGAVNLNNPNTWEWEDQGDISFDPNRNGIQIQPLSKFPIARYVKIYIPEKFKGMNDFAMIGDFSVFIFRD